MWSIHPPFDYAPIVGYAELLAIRPEIQVNPSVAGYVREIAGAAEAVTAKVRRLRSICRE
ncbi:MAG: hypothetical protein HY332_07515 [Chloroflexi bacterium]|nr:hypothetical protein [Chloroflexota bacterium]